MKKNTEKKVTADKAEIVNPIEGMKPRPNKAQVAEAMAQVEYERRCKEVDAHNAETEKARKAFHEYAFKLIKKSVQEGKIDLRSFESYGCRLTFDAWVDMDAECGRLFSEYKRGATRCYPSLKDIRAEIRARMSGLTLDSDAIVKSMLDTPAVKQALAGMTDSLFNRNGPKQLGAQAASSVE